MTPADVFQHVAPTKQWQVCSARFKNLDFSAIKGLPASGHKAESERLSFSAHQPSISRRMQMANRHLEFKTKSEYETLSVLHEHSLNRNIDFEKKISATIGCMRHIFTINDHNGCKHFVWTYDVSIFNFTERRIKLFGRRWDIKQGNINENFSVLGGGFAQSVGGYSPIIEPNSAYYYAAGVAVRGSEPFEMAGTFDAIDIEAGTNLRIAAETFVQLERPNISAPEIKVGGEAGCLSMKDALLLKKAARKYNDDLAQDIALFRTDKIGLSPRGQRIVSTFLIADGQIDRRKERSCDFSPIMPDKSTCMLFKFDDHYFLPYDDKTISSPHEYTSESEYIIDIIAIRSYNCPVMTDKNADNLTKIENELTRLIQLAKEELGIDRVKKIISTSWLRDDRDHDSSMDNPALKFENLDQELDALLKLSGDERRNRYFDVFKNYLTHNEISSEIITKYGQVKAKSLPDDILKFKRAKDAEHQRNRTARLTEEEAAKRRAVKAAQRRALRRAEKPTS